MRRILSALVLLAALGLGLFAFVARARPLPADALQGLTADLANGERVFWAGGCASCHAAADAKGEAKLVLKGGQRFPSPFGTFVAPNISPDPQAGIGGWTLVNLAAVLRDGVSPEGRHLFPALPYAAYAKMSDADLADLWAYLQTLPPSATPSQPHQIGFPFSIRRNLGLWKLVFQPRGWVLADVPTPELERGRYLVEALAHCGECHTPRNVFGGLKTSAWLSGAPNPAGPGKIPNITPAALTWSEDEIYDYLTTGFTPDFDAVGGHMAHVVENLATLPDSDRRAIVAYLKAIPGVPSP